MLWGASGSAPPGLPRGGAADRRQLGGGRAPPEAPLQGEWAGGLPRGAGVGGWGRGGVGWSGGGVEWGWDGVGWGGVGEGF